MTFFCGVNTLHPFVKASSQAQAVFKRCPDAFIGGAIQCSSMDLQLKKMLCSIIPIRQRRAHPAAEEDFPTFVHQTLSDQSARTHLDLTCTPSSDSTEYLTRAVDPYDLVTDAEKSSSEFGLQSCC